MFGRLSLEIRVNLVLIAFVAAVWLGLYAQTPARLGEPHEMAQLGALEDEAARHPGDARALVALSDRYLAQGFPTLAITVIRAAEAEVLEEPDVSHQLARAYENSGRLLDALATADLALTRCARVLGAKAFETAVPRFVCNERTLSKLDTHKGALERMVRWGVVDPRVDPRAQHAYDLALRRARIAVGELPEGATN
jgi:hypothetical protein